jgi:molecular chaperone DnaJ
MGIIMSYPERHGLRVIFIILLTLQILGLYRNIRNLNSFKERERDSERRERDRKYDESFKKSQEEYRRKMDEYQKLFDEFYRRMGGKGQNQYRQTVPNGVDELQKAYKLMGLNITDDVTTIKKRYRELAMKYHPDRFVQDTRKSQEAANRNFQKLNSAYNVIKKHKNIV